MENTRPHDHAQLCGGGSKTFEEAAAVLLVMCHPERLGILSLLIERELSISNLIKAVGDADGSLFQNLQVLKKAGLITTRRARETYYSCKDIKVLNIIKILEDEFGYCRQPQMSSSFQH